MDLIKEFNLEWKMMLIIICILIGATALTRLTRWLINKSFVTASERLKIDSTRFKFFKNTVSLIIWFLAFTAIISLIPKLKALAITLFAGAGILVAIIGLAAQQAFSNIISGVFIVLFRPFRVGDMVKVGTLDYGIVEDITLRHTIINNFENKRIIIPNSVIGNETIINDSIEDTKVCRWIEIGISYDSNVELAISIIQEEAMNHHACIDARSQKQIKADEPQVTVRLISFGDLSVNLRAYVWSNDPFNAPQMHSDLKMRIKKRFDSVGIEIPFPHRTLVYKKDLPNTATQNSGFS